jgi:DNA mismatch repair ATPase MutS
MLYQIRRAHAVLFFRAWLYACTPIYNDKALPSDISQIEAMELIRSAKEASLSQKDTVSIADNVQARAGKRFLRQNLLEPPADLNTITTLQNLVCNCGLAPEGASDGKNL